MTHFSCRKEPQVLCFFHYDFYGETMTYLGFRCKLPIDTEFFHKWGSMYVVAKTMKLDYWLDFRRMRIFTTDICWWEKRHKSLEKTTTIKKVIFYLKWYPSFKAYFFPGLNWNMLRLQFNPWDLILREGCLPTFQRKCVSVKSRQDHKLW